MGLKEPLLPEPCAPELPADAAGSAAQSRPPPYNPAHPGVSGEFADEDDEFETVPVARTRAPPARSRCAPYHPLPSTPQLLLPRPPAAPVPACVLHLPARSVGVCVPCDVLGTHR
jgi:hypothetical protein